MSGLNPLECALREADAYRAQVKALAEENAKLRELVRALADCRNTTCDDCVRWDYPEGGCSLNSVMRELGIEVGE